LIAGTTETAVAGLRRAVAKDPKNKQDRLARADALAASRLDDEGQRASAFETTKSETTATHT